eukprot:gene18332-18595_t
MSFSQKRCCHHLRDATVGFTDYVEQCNASFNVFGSQPFSDTVGGNTGCWPANGMAKIKPRSIKYQFKIAKLPLAKDIDNFVFTGTHINEILVRDLATGAFLANQRNAVLIGGSGTSKTHLGIASNLTVRLAFSIKCNLCHLGCLWQRFDHRARIGSTPPASDNAARHFPGSPPRPSAAHMTATLDRLSGRRMRVNVVTGGAHHVATQSINKYLSWGKPPKTRRQKWPMSDSVLKLWDANGAGLADAPIENIDDAAI